MSALILLTTSTNLSPCNSSEGKSFLLLYDSMWLPIKLIAAAELVEYPPYPDFDIAAELYAKKPFD